VKLFSRLYVLVMQWARHKYAPWYLAITAFIESIFWPIPVDVMLAPWRSADLIAPGTMPRWPPSFRCWAPCLVICSAMPCGSQWCSRW
jgi:hypothetical protein